MLRIVCRGIAAPFVFILFVGCGGGRVDFPISGSVRYDGKPVPDGTISFVYVDHPEWSADGAVIKDGAYAAKVRPGKARVEITGNRPITDPVILKKAGSPPPREDYIPAKHNTDSKRTVEISGPDSALNFDLER